MSMDKVETIFSEQLAIIEKQGASKRNELINQGIIAIPEVNEIYEGTVKSIQPYGAFVEILPGKDGLLHISEIEWRRLEKVEEVLKEGDKIEVKLIDVDPKNGKLKLSRKVLLPKPPRDENRDQNRDHRRDDRPQRNDN